MPSLGRQESDRSFLLAFPEQEGEKQDAEQKPQDDPQDAWFSDQMLDLTARDTSKEAWSETPVSAAEISSATVSLAPALRPN